MLQFAHVGSIALQIQIQLINTVFFIISDGYDFIVTFVINFFL